MLLTVRRPGARIAPISSTSACRQLRWRRSGAKRRITAAKRAGRRGMAAVLWRGRPSLAAHPLRRLSQRKWPKSNLGLAVELDVLPAFRAGDHRAYRDHESVD